MKSPEGPKFEKEPSGEVFTDETVPDNPPSVDNSTTYIFKHYRMVVYHDRSLGKPAITITDTDAVPDDVELSVPQGVDIISILYFTEVKRPSDHIVVEVKWHNKIALGIP